METPVRCKPHEASETETFKASAGDGDRGDTGAAQARSGLRNGNRQGFGQVGDRETPGRRKPIQDSATEAVVGFGRHSDREDTGAAQVA